MVSSHELMSKSKAPFPEGRGHARCAYRSTGHLRMRPGSSANPAGQGLSKWKRDQSLPEYSSAQLRIPGGPPPAGLSNAFLPCLSFGFLCLETLITEPLIIRGLRLVGLEGGSLSSVTSRGLARARLRNICLLTG